MRSWVPLRRAVLGLRPGCVSLAASGCGVPGPGRVKRGSPRGRTGRVGRGRHPPVPGGGAADDRASASTMSWSVTSATITVMLSGPPPRSASWTSRSAHWFGSEYSRRVVADGLGADHAGEAVAADQIPVAGQRLAHGVLRVDVPAVEGAGQQRPLRVAARLLRGDPALVDQHLDVRVVLGDLGELAVAQQIGPRVADVDHADTCCRRRASRSAWCPCPPSRGWRPRCRGSAGWRCRRPPAARRPCASPGTSSSSGAMARDDDVAGDVTGGHAAHAVGDGEQPRPGVDGILVSVSDQTAVAAGRIAQGQSHGRNSREVRPMRIGTPRGTGVGAVTLARSRYVPLVEPRSSRYHCPARGTSRACRAEA